MKKLLTILLTLVMAVCLINLNNSYINAESYDGVTYTITYSNDGSGGKWESDKQIPTSLEIDDKVKLFNGSGENATYVYNGEVTQSGSIDVTKTIANKGASVIIDNTNKVVYVTDVPDGDPVPCPTIIFDGDWNVQKANDQNPPIKIKMDTGAVSNNPYGIRYEAGTGGNPGTATFTKSLVYSGSDNRPTLIINKKINIVIDNDISIANSANATINITENTTIDGHGHELKVSATNTNTYSALWTMNNVTLTIKDIRLLCDSKNNTTVILNGDFNLQGEVTIELINSGGPALQVKNTTLTTDDVHFAEDAKIKTKVGNADGDKTKDTVSVHKFVGSGPANGRYVTSDSPYVVAKYVKIVQSYKSPKPDPSPSEPVVKDESCEKVIGPTWHWNNDKGICEDYGVVGTSTR